MEDTKHFDEQLEELRNSFKKGFYLNMSEALERTLFLQGLASEIKDIDVHIIMELKYYEGRLSLYDRNYEKSQAILKELESYSLLKKPNQFLDKQILFLKSFIYANQGAYKESMELCTQLLEEDNIIHLSEPTRINILGTLAYSYYYLGYYHKALMLYYKTRSLIDRNNHRSNAALSFSIISCLLEQKRINAAFEELSLLEFNMRNNTELFVKHFIKLSKARCYLSEKEYEKSITYLLEVLESTDNSAKKFTDSNISRRISEAYLGLQDYDNASKYAVLSLENDSFDYEYKIIPVLIIIAKIMLETQDNYPERIMNCSYLKKFNYDVKELLIYAETISNQKENIHEKLEISRLLLDFFVSQKEYNQAIYYFNVIKKIESNIHDIQKIDLEYRLEADYKQSEHLKNLEHKDSLLREQKEISDRLESFARTVSHDMKEPLRTIRSFAQLLRRNNKESLSKDSEEYLHFIIDASERMNHQIDDLLNYAKLGVNMPAPTDVNLNNTLILIERSLHKQISQAGATIKYAELPIVKGHSSIILALFQNLISNAIKFKTKERPVVVTINFDCSNDSFWQFSIADNGIGMPKNMLEEIFMTFKRLHSYANFKGTGIGLATCKKAIEIHGGKIWVESEENVGSTFYFTLAKDTKFIESNGV